MYKTALTAATLFAAAAFAGAAQPSTAISLDFTPVSGSLNKGAHSVSLSWTGTLAPFGPVTLTTVFTATSAQTASASFSFALPGGFSLTAGGDVTAAQVTVVEKNSGSISSSATVTGGTGEFANATGSFNYAVGYTSSTGSLTGSGSITFVQVFPHIAADTLWQTDFVILNPTNTPVPYTLQFYPDSGTMIPIAGQGAVGQVSGTVAEYGTAFYTTAATADSDGWAELDSAAPLSGVAVFREANDQTSVLLSAPATNFTIPFDSTAPPNALSTPYVDGVAIANPDSMDEASITCQAYDSNGNALGGVLSGLVVPPSAHTAFLLQSTAPFSSLPSNTRGQLTCASTVAVSAVELRALGAQVSTMPVVTMTETAADPAAAVQVFPHVAADSLWQTDFVILNTSSSPVNFTLTLHPDSGTTIPIAGTGAVAQIGGTVAAHGTAFYTTDATADSDGWAELDSGAPLAGVAVFRETSDQTSVLLSAPGVSFTVPFDSTAPPNSPSTFYVDGLAIANSDTTNPASITCQAYDTNGNALGGSLSGLVVPPLGHTAFVLQSTAPFSSLPTDTRGQLACASTAAVSAVELRALGPQISTMPVITGQ